MQNMPPLFDIDIEQIALKTAIALNSELLTSNAAWGYSGSKEDFDQVYLECLVIATEEIYPKSLTAMLEAYWDIQLEVQQGKRPIDWYL